MLKGVFASDSHIDGARTGDFASMILQIFPTGSAPLLAMTSGMESEPCHDSTVNWFEENKMTGQVTINGAKNSSATTVTVDDASEIVPNTVMLVLATGEALYVSSIAGKVLTIVRGYGGTTAGALADNGVIQKIGTAFEEGSSRPEAVANIGTNIYNHTQIFRTSWDVTRTAKATNYRTGSIVAKNKADAVFYHSEELERSLIWGRRQLLINNNKPLRTMDGINAMIKTNVTAAGATTSYDNLDNFFKGIFSKNVKGKPNERVGFTGNTGLQVINNIARKEDMTHMNIVPGQTEYGLDISRWITPYGTIMLKTHPLMVENATWTKDLYVYHPGCIRTRYLTRTMIENYDKPGLRSGRDADYGVITTEMTVEYKAEVTGGKLTGLTAAA